MGRAVMKIFWNNFHKNASIDHAQYTTHHDGHSLAAQVWQKKMFYWIHIPVELFLDSFFDVMKR